MVNKKEVNPYFIEMKNKYVDLILDSKRLNSTVYNRSKLRKYLRKLEAWHRHFNSVQR